MLLLPCSHTCTTCRICPNSDVTYDTLNTVDLPYMFLPFSFHIWSMYHAILLLLYQDRSCSFTCTKCTTCQIFDVYDQCHISHISCATHLDTFQWSHMPPGAASRRDGSRKRRQRTLILGWKQGERKYWTEMKEGKEI